MESISGSGSYSVRPRLKTDGCAGYVLERRVYGSVGRDKERPRKAPPMAGNLYDQTLLPAPPGVEDATSDVQSLSSAIMTQGFADPN